MFVYSGSKLVTEYSTKPVATNPTTSYTATDRLGSPRVITNSLGEVVSRRDFMPFGEEITNQTGERQSAALKYNAADNVRQKFTGYQKDDETELDFAEARMYENRHGRFTAVDPLLASGQSANPQTFNRFVYVMNNPLIFTDPSGLQAASTPRCDPCATSDSQILQPGQRREDYPIARVEINGGGNQSLLEVEDYATTISDSVLSQPLLTPPIKSGNTNVTEGNNIVSQLTGGFPANPWQQVAKGFGTGLLNIPPTLWNTVASTHPMTQPFFMAMGSNPLTVPTIGCDTSITCSWSRGTTMAGITAPGLVSGIFSGGGSLPSVVPRSSNSVVVTEKGLNIVKSHISKFDYDEPTQAMIKRLENALANERRITGADRNFYMHELKENTLMRRGFSYNDAHPMALRWDRMQQPGLYHPNIIRANPSNFSDAYRRFWGIAPLY